MSKEEFRCRLDKVNDMMRQFAKGEWWLSYHHHKGFWEIQNDDGSKREMPISIWSKDGIHPNTY